MVLISQSGLVTEKLLKGCHLEPKLIRAIPQLQFHCLRPLHCILPYFFLFSFLTFSPFAVFDISESAVLENGLALPGFRASAAHICSQVQGGISANTCSLIFARTLGRATEVVGAWVSCVYSAFEGSCTPLAPLVFE